MEQQQALWASLFTLHSSGIELTVAQLAKRGLTILQVSDTAAQHSTQVLSRNTHSHRKPTQAPHFKAIQTEQERETDVKGYLCIFYNRDGHEREMLDKNVVKRVEQVSHLSIGVNISSTVPPTRSVLRIAPAMNDYNVCAEMCVYSQYTNTGNL